MSGPIVRTGTNPRYWENWDAVFGGKKSAASAPKAAVKKAVPKKKAAPKKVTKRTGARKK
jgi:hypothetical protein